MKTIVEELQNYRALLVEGTDFESASDTFIPKNGNWYHLKSWKSVNSPNAQRSEYFDRNDPTMRILTIYNRLQDTVHILVFQQMGPSKDFKFDNSDDAQKFLDRFGIKLDVGRGYIR